jgi:hypothetical protein
MLHSGMLQRDQEVAMTIKYVALAISVLSMVAMATAPAAAKHQRKHARVSHSDVHAGPPARVHDEPRMVQVRPGLWISSWDCIQDEGNGRWTPCSIGNAGSRGN